jgi:type VI secretion system protein ImpH
VRGPSSLSAAARFFAEPRRFRFDAAVRLLLRRAKSTDPAAAMRFTTPASLAYPGAEIAAATPPSEAEAPQVATPVLGLAGPAGVLPALYREVLVATLRNRSRALADFLDMLAERLIAMFARAGIKYRLNRSAETAAAANPPEADRVSEALLAFTGYATPQLASRLAIGVEPLLHYSGLFASHPRSAERLKALVSDWLGRDVEIVEFAGAWLPLPADQQSALACGRHPGQWNGLGESAAIGVRARDPQARIILRIGPLDLASFAALLPDRPGLQRLVALVRAFLGFEIGFAVNPVLAGPEVPPLRLGPQADPPPRIGWNTWAPPPGPPPLGIRRPDAAEAVFEAEIVEAEEIAGKSRR